MAISFTKLKNMYSLINPLIRPRLSLLNAISAVGGYSICSDDMNLPSVLGLSVGVTFSAFSASAFNQVIETDRDAIMDRTKSRPLPMKSISKNKAMCVGIFTGLFGICLKNFSRIQFNKSVI